MRQAIVLSLVLTVPAACVTTSLGGGDGSQPASAAAISRALEGGLIGRAGIEVSRGDRQKGLVAEYRALEYMAPGEAISWRGDGASGVVTAAQPYRVGSQDCRPYAHELQTRGGAVTVRGTACRGVDGTWTPLS